MFRQLKLNNNKEEFKVYLYKNRREILAEIPLSCIKKINRNLEEIDTMEIEIPKYIQRGEEKVFNSLYMKIMPRQQMIIEFINGNNVKRERFVLMNRSRKNNKNSGVKKFTAYSFEYTLKTTRCEFPSSIVQLKKDSTHIAKGIMDLFEEQTGWGIDYVDQKSRVEIAQAIDSVNVILRSNFENTNVAENGLIFDQWHTTTISDGLPLYLDISYINLKTWNGNTLLKTEEITNTITEPIAKNIKRIRAYHHSEIGNRYGIKYIFTTVDNIEVERICHFTNVVNKRITADNIKLRWEKGNVIEKENIKYINIETSDTNFYDFLRDVQDQFNSLFLFDTYNKKISVVHRDNIGKESNLLLSYDNNIIDIDVTEQSEYPNALKVIGNQVSISSENIWGGDIIYDFSWYKEHGIMSDELIKNYTRYEKLLSNVQQTWYTLRNNIMEQQQRKTAIDSEISSLDYRIKYYRNLLSGFIATSTGATDPQQTSLAMEIESLESQLSTCLAKRKQYEDRIIELEDEMSEISNSIKMENAKDGNGKIFTNLDLQEYNDLLVYETYNDNYYSTPYGLYNNAKVVLKDMIKPEINFTLTTANLCKLIRNKKGWNETLALGDLFMIDDEETISDIKDEVVRLISYDYEPCKKKVSNLVFTNKIHKINKLNKLSNIGRQSASNNNVINNFKEIWEISQMQTNYVAQLIDGTLDATATAIRSRNSKCFLDISDAGIYINDATDMDKGIYLGCHCIAITHDGWKTSDVAISSDGIVAKLLVGQVILGNKLEITTDNARFTIGDNEDGTRMGVHVKDEVLRDRIFLGLERQADGSQLAKLELKDPQGREVVISEKGIISHNQYQIADNMDASHPMYCYYTVDEGVYEIRKVKLFLKLEKYRAFEKGMASGGSVQTTVSGGGSTSGSGGSYSNTFGSTSAVVQEWGGGLVDGQYFLTNVEIPITDDTTGEQYHYHTIGETWFRHSHYVSVPISIPNHYHTTPNHTHSLNTTHSHNLSYGIYEDSKPTNVAVYVNGNLVVSGINNDREIDVTRFMELNKVNEIKITSATNGRIVCNVFSKTFVGY